MRRALAALALLLGLHQPAAGAEPGVLAPDAAYPEGPLWQGETLYYAEMTRDRVMRHADGTAAVFWSAPGCGPTALAPYRDGFLVLCHLSGRLAVVDSGGGLRRWIEQDDGGRRLVDPNDAAADGEGGVYLSDPGRFGPQPEPQGVVLYLAADGALTRVAEGLRYANGVTVDGAGGRLLISEHIGRRIWAYAIRGPGRLGAGRILLDLAGRLPAEDLANPLNGPDGLELDPAGRLLFALYGTGRLMMLGPDGSLATVARLPEPYITNLSIDAPRRRIAVTAAGSNRAHPFPGRVLLLPLPPD